MGNAEGSVGLKIRDVPCDSNFFIELCIKLKPEERWTFDKNSRHGILLKTAGDPDRALFFYPVK